MQNALALNLAIEPYVPMAITQAQACDIQANFRCVAAPNNDNTNRPSRSIGIQF